MSDYVIMHTNRTCIYAILLILSIASSALGFSFFQNARAEDMANVNLASKRNILVSNMSVGINYWAGTPSSYFINRDLPYLNETSIKILRMNFSPVYHSNLVSLVPVVLAHGFSIVGVLINEDLVNDSSSWANWVYNTVLDFKPYVKVWEVWNEPNWGVRFQNNATGYTEFLKSAHVMAKQANPNCTILGGALLGTAETTLNYLNLMYADGAGKYMDALSIHPYCNPDNPAFPYVNEWEDGFWQLQNVRDVMVSNGFGNQTIWITEVGWPTQGKDSVTEQEQAFYLAQAMQTSKSWNWVGAFVPYEWMDSQSESAFWGIVREQYNPPYSQSSFAKPAFYDFVGYDP